MEGVISSNGNVDIVVNYIERNRERIQETIKMLDMVSKKVCEPAIELTDKVKGRLTEVHKSLKDIDKKAFAPVLDIADKAKDKITGIQKGMQELDKNVVSPLIRITGGDKSKLKFLEDGLKALDNRVCQPVIAVIDRTTEKIKGVREGLKTINNTLVKPAIELVDGTKNTIKSVKAGLDFISSNGMKAFDMVGKSVNIFTAALDMAKAGTIGATLAQWGFNAAMFANPVTWIVLGVIALIAAIVLLAKNWDKVKVAITGFVTWVKGAFLAVGAWLTANWKKVVSAVLIVMGPIGWAVLALVRVIRTNWNSVKETVIAVWKTVADFFTGLWDNMASIATSVWNSIGSFISGIGDAVRGVWEGIMNWFSEKFEWLMGVINEIANNPVFQFIASGVKSVVEIGGKVISGVADWSMGPDEKQPESAQKKPVGKGSAQKSLTPGARQYHPAASPVSQYKEHSKSVKTGRAASQGNAPGTVNITIPKLADSIVVREKEDIDNLAKAIVAKLKEHSVNMGVA